MHSAPQLCKLYVLIGFLQLSIINVHTQEASSLNDPRDKSSPHYKGVAEIVLKQTRHINQLNVYWDLLHHFLCLNQNEMFYKLYPVLFLNPPVIAHICAPTLCSCAASIKMVPIPHIGSTTLKPGWETGETGDVKINHKQWVCYNKTIKRFMQLNGHIKQVNLLYIKDKKKPCLQNLVQMFLHFFKLK